MFYKETGTKYPNQSESYIDQVLLYACNLHYIYKMCFTYVLIGVIMILLVEQCRLTQSSNNHPLHPCVLVVNLVNVECSIEVSESSYSVYTISTYAHPK